MYEIAVKSGRPAGRRRARCPKCSGQLYLEHDIGTRGPVPPEWACLQCGWRRSYSPRQFATAFALEIDIGDAGLADTRAG